MLFAKRTIVFFKKQFPFLTVISEKEQLSFLQQNLLYEKEQGAL